MIRLAAAFLLALVAGLLVPTPVRAQTAEELEKQYGRAAMEQALDVKRRYDLYGIHFDFDRAVIQPQAQPLLDDLAQVMRTFSTWRLEIVGHTDATGDAAYNELLSRQRADAVKAALVERGIAATRLEAAGAGQSRPVATNDTVEGRALNRRVELVRLEAQPNVLVIWGDDIGQSNISAYTMGLVGYRTPNIDRIAKEGMIFTDYYGEQSCTAGRSSFITGQSVFRTGLSKVGLPGAELGMRPEDPTIATVLKARGYATGQFGKNHLGDRDEHLPTMHGFDEFLGNLYHLNAEEEPENEDYPKDPEFRQRFGPRGVLHSWANADGTQRIENTGPLTRKRMETIDDETSDRAIGFMREQVAAKKPFFVWWNGTRMHFRTHVKPELRGISGQDEYADGMVEHDMHVGKLLKTLDELGIADSTLVFYSTDNGPHYNTWPDAAATPFRGEKNTNWEGGWRVPAMVRWPGRIQPGSVTNQITHHMDWLPTLAAAAGDAGIKDELLRGTELAGRSYKAHLDGYDLLPLLTGQTQAGPRKEIFYFSDDGDLTALRYQDWKILFMEQKAQGTLRVWMEPFVPLRLPLIENLRRDPYERATITSNTYHDWQIDRAFLLVPAQAYVAQFLATFKDYPPRQKAASFSLDQVMEQLTTSGGAQ